MYYSSGDGVASINLGFILRKPTIGMAISRSWPGIGAHAPGSGSFAVLVRYILRGGMRSGLRLLGQGDTIGDPVGCGQ